MQTFLQRDLQVDPALIRRFDIAGPRYTSYPTADRFVEAFSPATYEYWLKNRAVGGISQPLSVYVHVPFCENICYYCACNKIITRDHGRSAKYIRYLAREIEMQAALLPGERAVQQLHWGGGTPTFLADDEMRALMAAIRRHFPLKEGGEYSIEVDPRSVDAAKVALLGELGFNRMSVGVQDFDPAVQQAIHREQSFGLTMAVIDAARRHGFKSLNLDLIYGLPRQSAAGFDRTLDLVIEADPERISLYNYAHLPSLFKPQRRIDEGQLPDAEAKLEMMVMAIRKLTGAGYVYIGMDHFAKPKDDLAVAQRQGRLHRNFQGYSTCADSDLLAFGITGIGKVGPTYSQNVRTLDEYYDRLDRRELPVFRGIELSPDDLLRRTIIQQLMCNFSVSIESLQIAHLIDFKRYFAAELRELAELEAAGLVGIDDEWLTVTPRGRLLLRRISMVFDRYLRAQRTRAQYSKVI